MANKRTKLVVGKSYKVVFTNNRWDSPAEAELDIITKEDEEAGLAGWTVRQAHGYISSWLAAGNTTAEITEVSR